MTQYMSMSDMTHGEIMRTLVELRDEIRELRHDLVQKEVYEVQRLAIEQRIKEIETDRSALRRMAYMTILGVIATAAMQAFQMANPS